MPPDFQTRNTGSKSRPAPYTKPTPASASSALPTPALTSTAGPASQSVVQSLMGASSVSGEGNKRRRKKRKRTQDGLIPEVSASGSQVQTDELVMEESPASQAAGKATEGEAPAPPSVLQTVGNALNTTSSPSKALRRAERAVRKRAEREAKASGAQAFMPIAEPAVASAVPEISPVEERKREEKLAKLQKRLDKALANAKAAEDRAESLRAELERQKEEGKEKDKLIERHARSKEELEEVVQCGVCMDTLKDPHVLSCGHIGCKGCLLTWFRSPGAYAHPPDYPIGKNTDLQFYTKQCHTCRATIVRRPTRMYIVSAVLGAIGLEGHVPAAVTGPPITAPAPTSPDATRFKDDPWFRTFPPEKGSYKLWDDADAVHRCPACGCEVDHQHCVGCGAEFSDGGEGSNWESADEDMSDLDDRERAHLLGLWRGSDEDDSEFDHDSDTNDIDRERELLLGLSPRGQPNAAVAAAIHSDDEAEDRAAQHRATRHRLAWFLDHEAAESNDDDSEAHDSFSERSGVSIVWRRRSGSRGRSPSAEGYDLERGDDDDFDEGYESSFIDDDVEDGEEGSKTGASSGSENDEALDGSDAEMDEDDCDIGLSVEDVAQSEGSDAESNADDGPRRTRRQTGAAGRADHPALAELRRRRELMHQRG